MLSLQMEKTYPTSITKLLMAMGMWFRQLTILFISIFMVRDKLLVWIMENKLAVSATKLKQMEHGKDVLSMVKGLSL